MGIADSPIRCLTFQFVIVSRAATKEDVLFSSVVRLRAETSMEGSIANLLWYSLKG